MGRRGLLRSWIYLQYSGWWTLGERERRFIKLVIYDQFICVLFVHMSPLNMKERITQNQKKINKTKNWFFEKIYKIDKPLSRLLKNKEGRSKYIKSKMKEVATDTTEIERITGNNLNNYIPKNWTTWKEWVNF